MRKHSSVERIGLCLGMAFILIGGWLAIFPKAYGARIPATSDSYIEESYVQSVTKQGCRVYGVIAVGIGLGLGVLAMYPLKQ